ncbi:MAG: YSC84-related protein [Pseudomonadota bacterium]
MKMMNKTFIAAIAVLGLSVTSQVHALGKIDADKASELNADAKATQDTFNKDQPGATAILESAKGVLTCPKITKAGLGIGVEGGKCALEVGGETVDYYKYTAGKSGFLAGISSYSMVMVFNDEAALGKFRSNKREWEVGADASVAVAKKGVSGKLDTNNIRGPIVSFIFGEKGLMYDASFKGGRFKRLEQK